MADENVDQPAGWLAAVISPNAQVILPSYTELLPVLGRYGMSLVTGKPVAVNGASHPEIGNCILTLVFALQ